MEKYIARDPRTGVPLAIGVRGIPRHIDEAYRPPQGFWDAIKHFEIIPLCNGTIQALEVRWKENPQFASRADGIRALPRVMRSHPDEVQEQLKLALSDISPEIRMAALFSLPYCALVEAEELFDHLHELLDDVDTHVRTAASKCLEIVAPVFPSATEEILAQELRSPTSNRRKPAYLALKEMCKVWPEVVVFHLDELLRIEDDKLRVEAARILIPLARTKSASVWDLIGWTLGDDSDQVRAQAARTLPTLATSHPRMAKILIENSLFDTCAAVRKPALRALNSMDVTGFRMNRLCVDGARHSDPAIRRACILMMPRLFTDTEMRVQAAELLRQETRPELIKLLEELASDPELEGGEDEKNLFLAKAPQATNIDGSPILPPPEFSPQKQLSGQEINEESKSTK
jgi:HEAT repeat protein